MELLIPGLILVALMVYASTRIKKATAMAFEREEIDTADFTLVKPEGFLHLLNGDPAFAFQAYSKEFGTNGSSEKRQATIDIRKVTDRDFHQVCEDVTNSGKLVDDKTFQIDEMHARSVEIELDVGDSGTVNRFLIIEAPAWILEIRTIVLKEHNDNYRRRIDELEESLAVKK